MSEWTDFRNKVEAFFQPVTAAAVSFAHRIEADAEEQASGDLKKAFTDAYAVYGLTAGDFQTRIIAAVTAFLTELVGDIVAIVKKDTTEATTPVVDPASEKVQPQAS